MPSTAMPSASFASMSEALPVTVLSAAGCRAASWAARARTSSLSSSSRQAKATSV
ncbi:Uncharacterised protein [Mycobacterium tuberculosis]|uniref:Uncharacterized protein n=1 Tax=Mycobacterium tuberculosis TaxID=1773 RepID=A0A0T9DIX5_MYCTX|nr:Uncharacterised protein [Mycobacterium tuberculosis]CFE79413.1 Uncharacterised protein [Mycobacterium tuberculosis]CFR67911.1 Uncharacterised protein [Mycobacterium tuberculosis]CKS38074.1 Uncharacterised protein [Mycobacterium tuberculosis]CKT57617.1 Uncharacterised protein [Mycobacterium tuberculosis]